MIETLKNKQKIRCAIYTRKSSEEGLEQEFNSLDAQRLAAESYIASQQHEGWVLAPGNYDDGGFSGGNMERPGLKRLFADIKEGKIDCIVVYKIDRLTRSLVDFSKIIEVFDEHNVSFVSVTQSFNTSNSMGRLMLNVLLSFAQYERELTGERIRDKVEASKKQGMWMGGPPPLGYICEDKKLKIMEEDAKIVRIIYQRFLETGSVTTIAREMNKQGFHTKSWISKTGKLHGGGKFDKKNIQRILENPIYAGKIKHKDKVYEGQHKSIIDDKMWQKAQDTFKRYDRPVGVGVRVSSIPLLKGVMTCGECGGRMIPTYTNKKGKRYRYYICERKHKGRNDNCSVGRLSAGEIENLVVQHITQILKKPEIIVQTITAAAGKVPEMEVVEALKSIEVVWEELFPIEQARIVKLLIKEVVVTKDGLDIRIFKDGLNTLSQELEAV